LYSVNDIKLSLRQLKRDLARLQCFRRKYNNSLDEVLKIMETEISTSGSMLGYRNLHHKINVIHKIPISRNYVAELQRLLDPEGVSLRKARRLKRRKYVCKGPNQVWHLDGYDKLKQFGFCIHGCIDGYSRKMLWLETSCTNNCPAAMAYYFTEYVKTTGGTARLIRADRGNENLTIAGIQRYFRRTSSDNFGGEKSFRFGPSTANQRIEAFWSIFKRSNMHWWINYFKDMQSDGSWFGDDAIHRECLKFCYNCLIQKDLDIFKEIHNSHRIRKYPNQECPSGRPNIIYAAPGCYGTFDYLTPVVDNELRQAVNYVTEKPLFSCGSSFQKLALELMVRNNLVLPKTVKDARTLYDKLNDIIINL